MRKLFFTLCAMCLVVIAGHAIPAKRGFYSFKQSDGSTVTVEMRGDEFHHSFVTQDGLTVARGSNGDFYYRTPQGVSQVMAHDQGHRHGAELSFIQSQREELNMNALARQSSRAKTRFNAPVQRMAEVPKTGKARIPVLLVNFSDKAMSNGREAFLSQYDTGAKSVRQYFLDQSSGQFEPQFDVFGIYTLGSPRATYGGNNVDGSDRGVGLMVGEAVDLAHGDTINWKNYDNDGDGVCDVVIVVYAGVGEAQASRTVPDAVWPCQWNLSSAANYGDGTGRRTYDNVVINKFAVFNEVNGSNDSGTHLDGIGTFCHEFSHCLGLPDFYDTRYTYYGMGSWSLMDYGSYNDNGYTPIGYSAYEKSFMGWIDPIDAQPNTKYTLPVLNKKNQGTERVVKIVSDVNSDEYFLLENRRKQGWDQYISDEGVMITHVSYLPGRWDNNTVNNQSVQLMTLAPADNILSLDTEVADLFGESNHDFTDSSSPASRLFLTASGTVSSNAGNLGKPVTDIVLNSDSTASFWYVKGAKVPPVMLPIDSTQVTMTSFKATWSDATAPEDIASYTLYVNTKANEPVVELLLDEDVSGKMTSWTKSTSTYSDVTGYLRLGSSKLIGYVTSPAIDLASVGGKVTVKIMAKAYGSDTDVPMKVSVLESSVSTTPLSSQTFTLTSNDAEYIAVLDGKAAAGNCIKIENVTKGKRVLLNKVKVYSGDAGNLSAAPRKVAAETGNATQRVITGITDTCYTVQDLTPGETFIYRVKAVYTSGEQSLWSNQEEITLFSTGLPGDVNEDGLVDVADVTTLINYILGLNPSPCNLKNGDVNLDGIHDVADVTGIINIILKIN